LVHRKIRGITLLALIIVFVPAFIYIIGLSTNNPSFVQEEANVIPIRFGIYVNPINYSKTPDINLGIWIRFNGTLVAGKEASVDAKGFINSTSPITNFILQMEIFFKLSVAYPIHNASNGLPAETRLELHKMAPVGDTPLFTDGPIYIAWPNSGDYAPTVGVIFWNYTEIEKDVPYVTVHVAPTTELQAENFNRINTGLTYALVAFGIIEIALSGSEYLEGYVESRSIRKKCGQQTTNHEQPTEEGKRPPI
jgi:hypothetical protein